MIDSFMLGAVMQQDPFLEEFGSLPDEPPDEVTCCEVNSTTGNGSTMLEQGTLFDMPEVSPKRNVAIHPNRKNNPPMKAVKGGSTLLVPKPYEPRHISYKEFLTIFNGNHALALFWFNKQSITA